MQLWPRKMESLQLRRILGRLLEGELPFNKKEIDKNIYLLLSLRFSNKMYEFDI
jgi:hypothetical protein